MSQPPLLTENPKPKLTWYQHAWIGWPIAILFFSVAAYGQSGVEPISPDNDFAPGLLLGALIVFALIFVLVGIGIVLAALFVVLTGILAGLGMISTAGIVALLRRRFSSGVRALYYQICMVAAMPCGAGVLGLARMIFSIPFRGRDILIFGSIAGGFGGLLLAIVFDRLGTIAWRRYVAPRFPLGGGMMRRSPLLPTA